MEEPVTQVPAVSSASAETIELLKQVLVQAFAGCDAADEVWLLPPMNKAHGGHVYVKLSPLYN